MIRAVARSILRPLGLLPAARSAAVAWRHFQYRIQCLCSRSDAGGLPIAPMKLNFLVTGVADDVQGYVKRYVKGGQLAAQAIRSVLERSGISIDAMDTILDFGCGSGRVIRYWRDLPATVYGCDYNPDLLRWCERHLRFARFQVNESLPPLKYQSNFFDLIYALSVFTHLDEPAQLAWIHELRRVAKPGGHVIITIHGRAYLKGFSSDDLDRFHSGQLVVRARGDVGSNAYGAYHPVAYVRSTLAEGFAVVSHLEEGARGVGQQDLYLLRKL
jgi:SAM-dependent methyltransferase